MLINAVQSYLQLRNELGFDLRHDASLLRRFAHFASERGEVHVRNATAIDWASHAPNPAARDRRLKSVIRFARHVHAEDDRHEIPADGVFGYHRQRRLPFIFTSLDVRRFLEKANHLGPAGSLRPYTYFTLFALLSASGLRISEALALQLADVTRDGVVVRQTKFRKSRLVPLHETAIAGLQRYLERRLRLPGDDKHVFVSLRGHKLCYENVRSIFNSLVQKAGLQHGPSQRAPHIHSFRHTFAVRALEGYHADRDQIGRHMLALSTYMGHAHIADTYWYLQVTPQLLTDIRAAWEALMEGENR
jgi:integrase/recombinase XerD